MKKFLAGLVSLALVFAVVFSFAACGGTDRHHEYDGKVYELTGFVFAFQYTSSYIDADTGEEVTSYNYSEVNMEDMLSFAFRHENGIEQNVELDEEQSVAFNEYKAEFVKSYIKCTEGDNQFSYQVKFEDGKALFVEKNNMKLAGKEFNTENVTSFSYELEENDYSSLAMIHTNNDTDTTTSVGGFVKFSNYNTDKEYDYLIVKANKNSNVYGLGLGCTSGYFDFIDDYEDTTVGMNFLGYYEVYSLVK